MTAWAVAAVCNLELAERRKVLHIVLEHIVAGVADPIEVVHKVAAAVLVEVAHRAGVVASSLAVLHRAVAVVDRDHYTCVQASLKTEHPLYT